MPTVTNGYARGASTNSFRLDPGSLLINGGDGTAVDPVVSAKYNLDSANIVTMAVSASTLYCTLTPITGATGTTVITVVATAQSGTIKSAQAPITLA